MAARMVVSSLELIDLSLRWRSLRRVSSQHSRSCIFSDVCGGFIVLPSSLKVFPVLAGACPSDFRVTDVFRFSRDDYVRTVS